MSGLIICLNLLFHAWTFCPFSFYNFNVHLFFHYLQTSIIKSGAIVLQQSSQVIRHCKQTCLRTGLTNF